jgi:hypothetical protein
MGCSQVSNRARFDRIPAQRLVILRLVLVTRLADRDKTRVATVRNSFVSVGDCNSFGLLV